MAHLPEEIIANILSFAPIVAPHSTCIKQAIQDYEENQNGELELELSFVKFLLWNNCLIDTHGGHWSRWPGACNKEYWIF